MGEVSRAFDDEVAGVNGAYSARFCGAFSQGLAVAVALLCQIFEASPACRQFCVLSLNAGYRFKGSLAIWIGIRLFLDIAEIPLPRNTVIRRRSFLPLLMASRFPVGITDSVRSIRRNSNRIYT
ncbi:MAG: hypothetical protein M2R45_04449 [Verrucomicrobia subdivision 3 bacterium]|nr:hypothetical protein [Limisphaerales bacterium]MCS1415019.1 hypothetical protein [Limisphaerales bacterium]